MEIMRVIRTRADELKTYRGDGAWVERVIVLRMPANIAGTLEKILQTNERWDIYQCD